MRITADFDKNWKFHLGELALSAPIEGFKKTGRHSHTGVRYDLDDSGWRDVDLPHDYVIEGDFVSVKALQDTAMTNAWAVESSHTEHGSLPRIPAWYRKHFPKMTTDGTRVLLRFEGIFRDSEVYVNEFFVGRHMSGYTGVTYDITDFLFSDKENVLAVHVDPSKAEGWFYEGGGFTAMSD